MDRFNELKDTLMDMWVDVHMMMEDMNAGDSFIASLEDQVSGYSDMSLEDADSLNIDINGDDEADEWECFVNQCAKEYLIRWDIATRYPDADIKTANDAIAAIIDDDSDIITVDDFMNR